MNKIESANAPAAIGPYSQAIAEGNIIFTSGQIPIDPATGTINAKDIESQTIQVIKNLQAVLTAAGSDLDKVIKTTCFLADMNDFEQFNKTYAEYFTGKPARSCVEVSKLPKGALVEIETIAIR